MVTLQYGPEPSQYPAESAPKRHSWPLRGAERLQPDWFTPILRGVVLKRQNVVHLRPRVGPSTRQFNSAKRILAYDFGSGFAAFGILSGRGVTIRVAADTMKCGGRFG